MPQHESSDEAGRADARAGLSRFGWSEEWEKEFAPLAARGWVPGRVAVGYGIALHVRVEAGEVWAVVPGRMRHRARSREDVPSVGDWVALRLLKSPETVVAGTGGDWEDEAGDSEDGRGTATRRFEAEAVVERILPRKSRLLRKAAGAALVQQVLAANVDYAWLVSAIGPDFNSRRIERYLVLARDGGAQPVLLLNKADLLPPDIGKERVRVCSGFR